MNALNNFKSVQLPHAVVWVCFISTKGQALTSFLLSVIISFQLHAQNLDSEYIAGIYYSKAHEVTLDET